MYAEPDGVESCDLVEVGDATMRDWIEALSPSGAVERGPRRRGGSRPDFAALFEENGGIGAEVADEKKARPAGWSRVLLLSVTPCLLQRRDGVARRGASSTVA